jgi:hypothetical protein
MLAVCLCLNTNPRGGNCCSCRHSPDGKPAVTLAGSDCPATECGSMVPFPCRALLMYL